MKPTYMKRMIIYSYIFCCFLIILTSCNSRDLLLGNRDKLGADSVSAAGFLLLNRVANKPVSLRFSSESYTALEQNINNNAFKNELKTTAGFTYSIGNDTGGRKKITMQYTGFTMDINSNGNRQFLDAANVTNSSNAGEQMFGALKGAGFTAVYDSRHQLESIQGHKELYKRMDSIAGRDENAKKLLQQFSNTLFNEKYLQDNIQQTLDFMPRKTLKVGETWQKNMEVSGIDHRLTIVYKLENIENGIAIITANSEIAFDKADPRLPTIQFHFTGKLSAELHIEANTGLLVESLSDFKVQNTDNDNIQMTVINKQRLRRE